MDSTNKKMALLGSTPIPKALLSLGLPTMVGMLINALYNLVDREIFVFHAKRRVLARRFFVRHRIDHRVRILHADIYHHSLKQALESLYRALDQGRCMPDAQVHSLLTKLVTAFLTPTATKVESAAQRMEQVTAYISHHLSERITLEDLAGLVHLSPSQLIRVFKRETGFSPHQYLLEARLNAARFSLASTQLSLSQIADQCGFADASALVNAFRKRTGMSPRAYALRRLGSEKKSEPCL